MLNPFPELLALRFFAPTLLRLVAALLLFYTAYVIFQKRDEVAHIRFPIIGKVPGVAGIASVIYTVLALMLTAGYYTQIAALLAGIGSLKSLFLIKRYPALVPLSRSTHVLLFVLFLSLLISGAGAYAFDVPL